MIDFVIALDSRLTDFELVTSYIPCNHFALLHQKNKAQTAVFAPRRFWSGLYRLGAFEDVLLYDGVLESAIVGAERLFKKRTFVRSGVSVQQLTEKLKVRFDPMDRIQISRNSARLLRAMAVDRTNLARDNHNQPACRNRGTHAVVFPDFNSASLVAGILQELHCNRKIQAVMPVVGEQLPFGLMPYGFFETKTTAQRLCELILTARLCIGPPGPFTYTSIHFNVPTAVITPSNDIPEGLGVFWGHVQRAYCPSGTMNHDVSRAIEEAAFFYEYILP